MLQSLCLININIGQPYNVIKTTPGHEKQILHVMERYWRKPYFPLIYCKKLIFNHPEVSVSEYLMLESDCIKFPTVEHHFSKFSIWYGPISPFHFQNHF